MCGILETEISIWQPNNSFGFFCVFLYAGEDPEDDVIQAETR
jgi:hypothetical protein